MGDMSAPLRVRTREGCRGGREQFTWNSLREQEFKDREQYLGASTKVGMMGKFGRYYVHDWYSKKRDTTENIQSERASVQAYEEELMQEALGMKPKRLLLAKKQLTEDELKEVLKRDDEKSEDKKGMTAMGPQKKLVTNEYGEQIATSNEDYVAQAAREAPIKGLGFAMHRNAKLEAIKAETFGTEGQLAGSKSSSSSAKIEPKEEVKRELDDDAKSTLGVADARAREEEHLEVKREPADFTDDGAAHSSKRRREGEDRKQHKEKKAEKKRKKAEKKLKKIEKKLKKAAKKERKASKHNAAVKSSSSSSSS